MREFVLIFMYAHARHACAHVIIRICAHRVTDRSLLHVPLAWTFTHNVNRAAVVPHAASFVLSDTLGLVSQHTGVVSVSRLTKISLALSRIDELAS